MTPASPANPFNDGSRLFGSAGLDMKYGLTSNLTVDATVNPDFGQVEVDPAVVNLSAFETFFEEKRAFFLEGAQTFNNFGRSGATDFWGFNNSEPQIFYSRRIGRSPQLHAPGDYADPPTATTILGAAKLTGKTSRGWSLGLLEAVTSAEHAPTRTDVTDGRALVEPFANYAVVRLQRDIGRRAGVGFIGTSRRPPADVAVRRRRRFQGAHSSPGQTRTSFSTPIATGSSTARSPAAGSPDLQPPSLVCSRHRSATFSGPMPLIWSWIPQQRA